MSHCDFTTNFKTGEICLPDYHGIQLNVRNKSLCLYIFKAGEKCLTVFLGHLMETGEICPLVYCSFYLYGRNISPCLFLRITKKGEMCPFVYKACF